MRNFIITSMVISAGAVAWAGPESEDVKSTPPPKGAIVLFDGKNTDALQRKDGSPVQWKIVEGGALEIAGGGDAMTKEKFKDFKLHVEFWLPQLPPDKTGQDRGNSGVYLQSRYEVQVLDAWNNPTYPMGSCGDIYKKKAADKNMAKMPGHWQSYDITFRAARFDASGKKTENAKVTVVWNGEKVHDNVEIDGPTGGGNAENAEPGPIKLQDHGHKDRYRNIWIVPSAS